MLPHDLMRSQLHGQMRIGRVRSVDAKNHRAEVEFFEQDGFVVSDLQVLRGFAADYCLPAQNTPVLCWLIDGRLGVGFVIGAFYTDGDAAPLSDAGQRAVAGDDLRLGAADADKLVAIDGDQSDGGTLVFVPGSGGAALTYFDPGAPVPAGTPGTPIPLKAKISAGATKVKAK